MSNILGNRLYHALCVIFSDLIGSYTIIPEININTNIARNFTHALFHVKIIQGLKGFKP